MLDLHTFAPAREVKLTSNFDNGVSLKLRLSPTNVASLHLAWLSTVTACVVESLIEYPVGAPVPLTA